MRGTVNDDFVVIKIGNVKWTCSEMMTEGNEGISYGVFPDVDNKEFRDYPSFTLFLPYSIKNHKQKKEEWLNSIKRILTKDTDPWNLLR